MAVPWNISPALEFVGKTNNSKKCLKKSPLVTDWLWVLLVRWMLLGPQVSIDILVDVWWGHMGRRLVRTSHRRGIIWLVLLLVLRGLRRHWRNESLVDVLAVLVKGTSIPDPMLLHLVAVIAAWCGYWGRLRRGRWRSLKLLLLFRDPALLSLLDQPMLIVSSVKIINNLTLNPSVKVHIHTACSLNKWKHRA